MHAKAQILINWFKKKNPPRKQHQIHSHTLTQMQTLGTDTYRTTKQKAENE